LLLHSLFSNVSVELAGRPISDPNNLYSYRAYIETLLSYDKQVLDTRGRCEGWHMDTAGSFAAMAHDGNNMGLRHRMGWVATSATVTLIGRPHLDLFHQEKCIPPNCSLKLRLIPQPNTFVLKTVQGEAANAYRVDIRSARMFIRMREVAPSLILAHEQMLQKGNFYYPFTGVTMKQLTIANGVTSFQQENVYMGKLPNRLAIGMVADGTITGSYTLNPYHFQNFGANYISIRVNGEQIPRVALQPNFAAGDYIREYMSVLEALGMDSENQAISLNPTEWAGGSTLFVFKLSSGSAGVRSIPKTGSVRLEIRFAAATNANINLILFAEFSELFEIDKFKNIIQ